MTSKLPSAKLRDLFSGTAESTFQVQLGVADPPLVDYLSELLVRFLRSESVYKVRTAKGRPAQSVFEMLNEAGRRIGQAKREVHRHIGDFALFWAGLYPESLDPESLDAKRLDAKAGGEGEVFRQYCLQGKASYRIASQIAVEDQNSAPADVLERLSDEFELCAYGLREVRRDFEQSDDDGEGDKKILPVLF